MVVSLDYRLGPHGHWPDQIVDVKCAIRYLRANARRFHIDPSEIGAWGQSAGGHLVALLGTAGPTAGWDIGAYRNESSGVQAVVDMAGPSDLLTMGDQGDAVLVAESFISLLGDVPNEQLGADLKKASPTTYVRRATRPSSSSTRTTTRSSTRSSRTSWPGTSALDGVPRELLTVYDGGHEFDTVGEIPSGIGDRRRGGRLLRAHARGAPAPAPGQLIPAIRGRDVGTRGNAVEDSPPSWT